MTPEQAEKVVEAERNRFEGKKALKWAVEYGEAAKEWLHLDDQMYDDQMYGPHYAELATHFALKAYRLSEIDAQAGQPLIDQGSIGWICSICASDGHDKLVAAYERGREEGLQALRHLLFEDIELTERGREHVLRHVRVLLAPQPASPAAKEE